MVVMGFAILLQKLPDPVPDVIVLAPDPIVLAPDPIVLASTDVLAPALVVSGPLAPVKTSANKKYNLKDLALYRDLESQFYNTFYYDGIPESKFKDLIHFCDLGAQYPALDNGGNAAFCPAKCSIGKATYDRMVTSNRTNNPKDIAELCAAARDASVCKYTNVSSGPTFTSLCV